jgi:two-component system, LuxR family, response regulator FixJ
VSVACRSREPAPVAPAAPRVWLVDPDPAMQGSVSWLLRHLGVDLRVFRYGREFLEAAEIAPPGCVLVDVDLPDVSGLEVLREVRARTGGKLPVIVLASAPDVNLAVQALRDGAADFFEKPFLGAALTRRVEAALGETRDDDPAREPGRG